MYKEYLYLPLYKSEFEHMKYIACFYCVIQRIYKANQYTDSIHFNIISFNMKYSFWSIQTDKANLFMLSAVTQTLNVQMHKSKIPTQNLQLWI